ncbi:MAG: hypothetical protein ACO3JL_04120, partial [Myxococcota bacterium]
LVGTKEDTLAELGFGVARQGQVPPPFERTARLAAWGSMLSGDVPASIEEMVTRLRRDQPVRFPDDDAAREEAKGLLWAAGVLW